MLLFQSLGGTRTVLCFFLIYPVECQLDPSPVVICMSCSVSAVDIEASGFIFAYLLDAALSVTWWNMNRFMFFLIHPVECQLDPSPVVVCVSDSSSALS